MAVKALTTKYEELVLEVEFVPGSGTYSAICGLTDLTINDTSNVDTSEIPYCDDESLPLSIERQVRSQEYTLSGSGSVALQSFPKMRDWKASGSTRNIRVRDVNIQTNGSAGDRYGDSGPALLTTLTRTRTKGKKVDISVEIQFDGYPDALTVSA